MKNELRIEIVLACKIHTEEEEALGGSPMGGGKEELGEGDGVLGRSKYDKTILLH